MTFAVNSTMGSAGVVRANSPINWFRPHIPAVDETIVIPGARVTAPPVVVEPPDTAARTMVMRRPVQAARHEPRGRVLSEIVEDFRDLAHTQFVTIGLLVLTLIIGAIFGANVGWRSAGEGLLLIASALYFTALNLAYAHAYRRLPRVRKLVAIFATIMGLLFSAAGVALNALQFLYAVVHSTGLI